MYNCVCVECERVIFARYKVTCASAYEYEA